MAKMAAREAKNRFGELIDTAQREPVIIEKHGRSVAVVVSATEYKQIETLRQQQLTTDIEAGIADLDAGRSENGQAALSRLRSELN